MKETLITFETAKLAKEKSFDIETIQGYRLAGTFCDGKGFLANLKKYNAPTQSILQKWLREKHELYVVHLIHPAGIYAEIYDRRGKLISTFGRDGGYETYEDALEVGLQEALKLLL